jgi:hypothetical protein
MNAGVLVLGCEYWYSGVLIYARIREYWYSGGSTGTLYQFLTYVEVDLVSWGGRCHSDSQKNFPPLLLENNHRNKVFLDRTGVIISGRTPSGYSNSVLIITLVSQVITAAY